MSDATQPKPRTRRGVKIALFLSLALNLLVAGLVLGAVVHHRSDRDGRPPRLDRGGGPMTAALSLSDRRAIGMALREAAHENRPTRADLQAEYRAVVTALKARPFDPQAVKTALEGQAQVLTRRAELGQALLLDRLQAMSDSERAAYAERLEEVLENGPPPREEKPHDGRRLPRPGPSWD
ncbi:MAG: periplasmic heavy metal sensor [Paracoccaceae bacterium]